MKFYLLRPPQPRGNYAWFNHLGTWEPRECTSCGFVVCSLIDPLVVEWVYGNNKLGDFSWCGYLPLVKDEALNFFSHYGDVELLKPTYDGRKKKNTVYVDADFPVLRWLKPIFGLDIDSELSEVALKTGCQDCARFQFKETGLFVRSNIGFLPCIFYIKQYGSSLVYINEVVYSKIKEHHFSNIDFCYAGELI